MYEIQYSIFYIHIYIYTYVYYDTYHIITLYYNVTQETNARQRRASGPSDLTLALGPLGPAPGRLGPLRAQGPWAGGAKAQSRPSRTDSQPVQREPSAQYIRSEPEGTRGVLEDSHGWSSEVTLF